MNDNSQDDPDPAQLSLGGIIANLPPVRAVRKANLAGSVRRRLIEPIASDKNNEARLSHAAELLQGHCP